MTNKYYSLLLCLPLFFSSGGTVFAQSTKSTNQPRPRYVTTNLRSGELLSSVAARLSVDANELARANDLPVSAHIRKGQRLLVPQKLAPLNDSGTTSRKGRLAGKRITFVDGGTLDVDDVWKQGDAMWYRLNGISASPTRGVRSVEDRFDQPSADQLSLTTVKSKVGPALSLGSWIYLVDGARLRVDEVREGSDGVWYNRGKLTMFLDRERIARIERERPSSGEAVPALNRDWTSGNPTIDQLIKTNGVRYGVDPYLVFLVIEQESHFHTRALSPKGARGLMQLMPGTARRLGVVRPFDAAQNIMGGTQYLRELMNMFGGNVNLVLASYNAGEGAVIKYGRNVPPYRETRDYVRTIGKRYGLAGRQPNPENDVPTPQR